MEMDLVMASIVRVRQALLVLQVQRDQQDQQARMVRQVLLVRQVQ